MIGMRDLDGEDMAAAEARFMGFPLRTTSAVPPRVILLTNPAKISSALESFAREKMTESGWIAIRFGD